MKIGPWHVAGPSIQFSTLTVMFQISMTMSIVFFQIGYFSKSGTQPDAHVLGMFGALHLGRDATFSHIMRVWGKGDVTTQEQDLHAFIRATFRSVWAIELLCHVRSRRDHMLDTAEIVSALRASHLVVEQGLADLAAAGLIVANEAGHVQYAPANPGLDTLASRAEAFYAKSPNAVRRMIIAAAHPGVAAFADAFKLRND
ncbi:MAG: hypothetical protein J7498_07525 [Sphingobium sp.]|nr:hypothetical protein [Sphingobium sp.]